MAAAVGGAFLSAFFEVIFHKLASPEVINFIRGKKLDPKLLQRLETTLKVVAAVLNDAEKKQIRDANVNKWLDDLKDAVYMADDFLDEVSTKASTQKEVTNLFSRLFNVQDREMVSRLEDIVDRLESILKLKESLDLREIANENLSSRTPSTSLQDGFHIFGRDGDKKAIMKLLLDESEEVSVIPIVGMGGVGKTTLAQMVYNDDNLKQICNFDFKAWVCVSEAFDILRVTKTLTEALTKRTCEMNDLNLLQENLLENLRVQKFLIILDDVWIEDYVNWNLLRKSLLRGIRGSKILVTTRSEKVASIVQTVCPYYLNQLSDGDCWFVFANHACLSSAFGENAVSLEKIGRMIVKKCKGLPLAAQSLGSLLQRKHDIRDWTNILNSDIWELSESESKIIPALRISYNYLPPHLKRCFVYCSLFPKDYEFVEDELILLWMAEDLLPPPKTRKTLEEVGYECFDDLVSSSFLQRSNTPWRESMSFVMHDLMHDLVTLLGGEFYSRLEGPGEEIKINDKTRHFYCPLLEGFEAFDRAKSLRTLLLTKCSKPVEEALHTELLKLKYLRVLSVRAFYNPIVLPYSAGTLLHLRYLDFSTTYIKSLPESLCNLYNLQTLKLDYCYELTMLPSGMQNLLKLRRLGIDETPIKKMPKGMGKLNQLQHLPYYIVGKDEEVKIKELGGLSNLHGFLSVKKLENVANGSEALEARMMDKKHINSLELLWSSNEDCINSETEMNILCNLQPHRNLQYLDIIGYRGTKFPDWLGSSYYHNMNSLRLSSCKNCCILPSLGHLPSLKHLYLSDLNGLEIIDSSFFMNHKSSWLTPFPSLESLNFERMLCWEVWSSFEGHAFPRLKHLNIKNCPKLRGDLPSDLPALETLEIEDCEQLVCLLLRAPVMWHLKIVKANKVVLQESPLTIEYLRLCDCSSVMSFPGDCFPASLKTLDIKNFRKLEFPKQKQTHELQLEFLEMHSSCDSLKCFPLETFPNLKDLYISDCENLESLSVSQLRDVSLQNLQDLEINRCPNLVSLAGEGLAAPSLTRIVVSDCDKLNSLPCRMNTLLPKLKELWIHNCPRVESFPEGASSSLREIHITDCEKLISLAWPSMDMLTFVFIRGPCDGIKSYPGEDLLPPSIVSLELLELSSLETLDCKGLLHLTSLKKLVISDCPKLKNMEGEGLPASLTELRIYRCPLLEERCIMKHPQIWPKISHIRRIAVDWTQDS
ncbi:putative disease resistance RPP13-like protein 1 [Lotus japonicus]|uniref:putative disease resistance RPP13-like protein 1 n=1 Tax=Lotus japonicus TaxID=34305 RepID=UPI0025874897|nr:putative disease resistance RPP13-like protein 1 [Lotus japonicus]XP_057446103.1 putative disease resistance RPP13-like protein 1 [Lotus japonicus]XP_057446104.1 putative disease resistance RPP13-like protein 1 [Lotus japonicus]